jgi:ParB-like chromosome segregation protein Spo0J
MKDKDLFAPLKNMQFVDRDLIKPNNYNPNKVLSKNMKLLLQSILANGFCFPIVIRPDYTIIDGFHRWLISGEEPLRTMLGGKIPVVIVEHEDSTKNMYGTVSFNRARGTHLLEPMENIVKTLIDEGKTVDEITKEMGMSKEEVYRLSKIDRDTFLRTIIKRENYSKAQVTKRLESGGL